VSVLLQSSALTVVCSNLWCVRQQAYTYIAACMLAAWRATACHMQCRVLHGEEHLRKPPWHAMRNNVPLFHSTVLSDAVVYMIVAVHGRNTWALGSFRMSPPINRPRRTLWQALLFLLTQVSCPLLAVLSLFIIVTHVSCAGLFSLSNRGGTVSCSAVCGLLRVLGSAHVASTGVSGCFCARACSFLQCSMLC
jgi:hypothetical protein